MTSNHLYMDSLNSKSQNDWGPWSKAPAVVYPESEVES